MIGRQLVLDVGVHERRDFDNFIVGKNRLIVDALKQIATSIQVDDVEFCYCLYGARGSGKTHLMSAVMDSCERVGRRCAYYPLEDYQNLDPRMLLDDLQPEVICIDDLQMVLGRADWECALFECYNRRQAVHLPMVISMLNSPKESEFLLLDLKSRLMAGLICKLQSMTDDERMECLQMRARLRGLTLTGGVARYLLEHYARDTRQLLDALDRLDVASMEKRRALTIPFIKQVLDI